MGMATVAVLGALAPVISHWPLLHWGPGLLPASSDLSRILDPAARNWLANKRPSITLALAFPRPLRGHSYSSFFVITEGATNLPFSSLILSGIVNRSIVVDYSFLKYFWAPAASRLGPSAPEVAVPVGTAF
jgi:hypothetical protein